MPNPGATAAANSTIGLLVTELHKKGKAWRRVREDCENLETDLAALVAYSYDEMLKDDRSNVARARAKEVRELEHDIEDCIERFMYRITCKDEASWLPQKAHAFKTWCIRDRFVKEMKKLNKRLDKAGIDKMKSSSDGKSEPAGARRQRDPTPISNRPVGIAMAKHEFLTLLDEVGNEPTRPRVITIVGFGGSGKTTLANAVFQSDEVQGKFHLRAWVDRADYNNKSEFLKNIILKFWPEEGNTLAESSDEKVLQVNLNKQLGNQRYLIVLDDMDMNHWSWIQLTFRDQGTSSRIIVTTTRRSAANVCCASSEKLGDGYVYHMRGLGDRASKTLAHLNHLAHDSCVCQQVQGRGRGQPECPSLTLQKKCNGLPLALVSVGNHLKGARRGFPTTDDCATLCNNLGSFLHENSDSVASTDGVELDSFADLRGVLMYNYNSLAGEAITTLGMQPSCLLYLGIFPDAQRIERKKITRRWVAEGYVQSSDPQNHADENFKKLVDRSIVRPVGINTNSTCKAVGILHEFVLHKSISENFIMTFDDSTELSSSSQGYRGQRRARHLLVRHRNITSSGPTRKVDLSHVRSLTVTDNGDDLGSGSACYGFFEFSKYKVIRVLDLEECTKVNDSHLESICMLWSLRYLSLGSKVNMIPKEIGHLKLLESLHLSKTVLTKLPGDIISMLSLIHLIGHFFVPASEVSSELVEKSERSELQTLSGIVARTDQGFLRLVPKMRKLRKVNICFSQGKEPILDLSDPLLAAIIGYLQRELGHHVPRSLCLDFKNLYETGYSDYPKLVMQELNRRMSLGGNYYLTKLKLHLQDELQSSMPEFIGLLPGLQKLCLSLTLLAQGLLSAIGENLRLLAHLKLKADRIHGDLEIHEGTFLSLETLSFEVRDHNCAIPQFHIRGVLPKLRSFQLLCKNLAGLCGININRLENLQEIELHADVRVEARQQWETAARNHRQRPNVLPFLSVDDPEGAAIPAAGAAQVVHGMPAAVAAAIITPEGAPLEGFGPADRQATSTSMAVDGPDEVVPVTATISNGLGRKLNEVGNPAPVDSEDEIVPVADGAEGGDEPTGTLLTSRTTTSIQPTEVLTVSASGNEDSAYPAKTVASATHEDTVVSPEHSMSNWVIPNNNGSDGPIDVDEAAPDATIVQLQPDREVSNHAPEHIASSGGHEVHAR